MKSFSEHTHILREEEQQLDEVIGLLGKFGLGALGRLAGIIGTGSAVDAIFFDFNVTKFLRNMTRSAAEGAGIPADVLQWFRSNPTTGAAILVAAGATVLAAQQAMTELKSRRDTRKLVKLLNAAQNDSTVGRNVRGDKVIDVTQDDIEAVE